MLHPALPDCPGHDNWKKQFKGSSGLFSFTLRDGYSKNALAAMLDGMDIFGMGASWGGYESLMIPAHPDQYRTAVPWPRASTCCASISAWRTSRTSRPILPRASTG